MFTEPTVCNCRWLPHRHRRGQYGCYWYRNAAGGPPAPRPLQSRAFWRALPAPDAGTPVAAAHRAAAALRPGMCVPPPDQEPPAGGWEPAPPDGAGPAPGGWCWPPPQPAADHPAAGPAVGPDHGGGRVITPDEAQERARRAHRRLRLHDAGLIAFFLLLALAVVVMCNAIGGGPQ